MRPYTYVQLLSGQTASGATGRETGRGPLEGSAVYQFAAAGAGVGSALVSIQGSVDGTAWGTLAQVTATNTTATGHIALFAPFVRAQVNAVWSAAGGTGVPSVIWAAP